MLGIFGTITNPLPGAYATIGGVGTLIGNIVKLITVAAGLWSFANLLIAGFTFITSSGEAEKIQLAWMKIWQSLIGLLIIVAAFTITAIISQLLFGSYTTILNPIIYGPGTP